MSGVRVSEDLSIMPEEILGYYDRPLLFLATWPGRGLHLFTLVDEDDSGEVWYAAPASARDVVEMGKGQRAFRDVYLSAPSGAIAVVRDPAVGSPVVDWVSARDIDTDSLPAEGFTLPLPYLEHDGLVGVTDVRAVPRFVGTPDATRAPHPSNVARMLEAFASMVVLGVAKIWGQEVGRRGAVPRELIDAVPMRTLGLVRASFGVLVEIGPETPQILSGAQSEYEENPVARVLGDVERLLDAAADREVVSEVFRKYGPRFAAQYRYMIESAVQAGAGLGVDWAASGSEAHSSVIAAHSVPAVLDAVRSVFTEQSEASYVGQARVTGFRDDQNRIWLVPLSGELYDEVGEDNQTIMARTQAGLQVSVPSEVSVRLRKRVEFDTATGVEREQWRLTAVLDEREQSLGI